MRLAPRHAGRVGTQANTAATSNEYSRSGRSESAACCACPWEVAAEGADCVMPGSVAAITKAAKNAMVSNTTRNAKSVADFMRTLVAELWYCDAVYPKGHVCARRLRLSHRVIDEPAWQRGLEPQLPNPVSAD